MQAIVYFTSILLTGALAGFLAFYAWRQRGVPGSRAYAGLALSECLLALAEILSMLSPTPALALFWFQVRYLCLAVIPVFWLVFALEYSSRKNFISKRLLAGLFIVPVSTQVLLWSNNWHGLWVKQEVGFHQSGPFWLAEIGARLPGLGFLTHSFYSLILLLAGIALFLITAWRMRRQFLGQALLLAGAGLTAGAFAANSVFNLIPQPEFNLFTPGLGLSVLLIALAVFRFQFLKRAPTAETGPKTQALARQTQHSLAVFLLIFILMATGMAVVGYLSYQNYERQFRAQVESQLASIAELKVRELETWRAERLADAEVMRQNPAFAALAARCLANPADTQAQAQMQAWLDALRNLYHYNRVFLLDATGVERISSPAAPEAMAAHLTQEAAAVLSAGQVTFLDFHRDAATGPIHLSLLVPILAQQDNRPLGLLVLRIDPNVYLYPFIQQWPVPSASAETLLVRREGADILFLNELKFQANTALNLRVPLENTQVLGVKAALGQVGIVEGLDYRGAPAIGVARAVPDSPWFLVARMDTAEVYAPLRERLWQTVVFFGALLATAGAGLGLMWRQQRARYYRGQLETLAALRVSEEKFRLAFSTSPDSITITRLADGMFVSVNKGFEQISGYTQAEVIGKTSIEINIWKNPEDRRKVVEGLRATGEVQNYEAHFLTRTGEIYGLMSAAVIQLQGEPHILNITRDITARKWDEEALRESEDKFKYVFDHSLIGKSITLPSGEISVNKAFVDMLGYTQAELQNQKWQNISHPDDIESTQRAVDTLLSGGQDSARFVKRYIHKNGDIVWADVSTSLRRDKEGRPLYFMTAVSDITDRKRAEEEIRQFNTTLEQRVVERTAQLQAVNQQLESEIAERKSEILARVQAEKELERRVAELSALNAMATIVTESLDVDEILNRAMDEALRLVGVEVAAMLLLDEKAGELALVAHRGLSDEFVRAFSRMKLGEGLAGKVAQTGQPAIMSDLAEYPGSPVQLAYHERVHVRSAASVPLVGRTGVIGVMNLAAAGPQYFDAAGVELLVSLGRQIAIGVEKARLYEAVQSELAERKRAEVGLRESEERFRRLAEAAFEAIIIHESGFLLSANDQFPAMFGYEPQELLGKQVMPLTIAPEAVESVRKEIATGGVGPYEAIGLRKDGTKFPMEIRVREMEYGERKVRVVAIMDITARKQAEEALQQYAAQLETANKELEAFAYSVSHDLRAPLRAMDGFSRILLDDYAAELTVEAQRYLGLVRHSAQEMGQLIEDLLSFSRLSRQPLNKQIVEPAQLVRQALDVLSSQQEGRPVEISIGDLPPGEADPALLKLVFINLIGNALKYTRRREAAVIEIGCQSDPSGEACVFFVKDNGVGFDMKYAPKLFGVFQRLHRAEDYEGTGVGLATVQRIIHRHGGRVWAEAAVDQGAAFYFTLKGEVSHD